MLGPWGNIGTLGLGAVWFPWLVRLTAGGSASKGVRGNIYFLISLLPDPHHQFISNPNHLHHLASLAAGWLLTSSSLSSAFVPLTRDKGQIQVQIQVNTAKQGHPGDSEGISER